MSLRKGELSRAFTYIEPGPVILLTASTGGKDYVMTLSWSMVMDFLPHICISTGAWNETFGAIMDSKECCICIPTVDMIGAVVGGVGMTHSSECDKFKRFNLKREKAELVSAPLLSDCQACLECKLERYIEDEGLLILRCVQLWENPDKREAHIFHAVGDGHFIEDGPIHDLRQEMAEKIPDGSERGLTDRPRTERYRDLITQSKSLIDGIPDTVSALANLTALIKEKFPEFFWVGFYLVKGDSLILGPFQGTTACFRIGKGKGVCGTAWAENRTMIVDDVTDFPGHIACSTLSKSEIVIPVRQEGQVVAVLDIDSTQKKAFGEQDGHDLEQLSEIIATSIK